MKPSVLTTVVELRAAAHASRSSGRRVGLVPTLGALHRGHLALIRMAQRLTDQVIVSLFVNPTQFGPGEDLARYPRDLEGDLEQCRALGVDMVFAPDAEEMYPAGDSTRVIVSGLTEHLCGRSRPTHFQGVATIVTKLFAAVGPCTAVFGRKDYQQLKVIERLVTDLMLPVTVIPAPIMREPDGLALSSRNRYLASDRRQRALGLVRALSEAHAAHAAGERNVGQLLGRVQELLRQSGLAIDYASINHPETLEPFDPSERLSGPALLALAGFVEDTRLIDNLVLGEEADPLAAPGATLDRILGPAGAV